MRRGVRRRRTGWWLHHTTPLSRQITSGHLPSTTGEKGVCQRCSNKPLRCAFSYRRGSEQKVPLNAFSPPLMRRGVRRRRTGWWLHHTTPLSRQTTSGHLPSTRGEKEVCGTEDIQLSPRNVWPRYSIESQRKQDDARCVSRCQQPRSSSGRNSKGNNLLVTNSEDNTV
jgi:hypothetical protein